VKCEQEEAADRASCQICKARHEAEVQACRARGSYVELGLGLSHKTQPQVSATDSSRTPPKDGEAASGMQAAVLGAGRHCRAAIANSLGGAVLLGANMPITAHVVEFKIRQDYVGDRVFLV